MAKVSLLIVLLPHLLCTMVQGQLPPCSEYFTHMSNPGTTDMLGQIEIPSPAENDEFHLRVVLNAAPLLRRSFIRLELARSIQESVEAAQQERTLLYHVYYPSSLPTPTLSGIWFNNQRYCSGPESTRNNIVSLLLGHIVYSPTEESLSQSSWPNGPPHRNASFYGIVSPSNDDLVILTGPRISTVSLSDEIANNECGITSYYTEDTNREISNGEETLPGQWPWLVALFILIPDELVNKFQCTGTILTTKHVITAARCLKWGPNIVDLDYLYVALGRFNSRKWHGKGAVNREVASYKIHPDADEHGFSGDSDLAILSLRMPIEFSPFVRAVCLWSGSTDLQNVVDKTGYVVGWGQDTHLNRNLDEPLISRVPIVSQEDCRRNHSGFTNITSDRTFCAGLLDESPCNVDGGSGLILFNATTGRYQLRGVAARTIHGLSPCFISRQFIVYVDVAKYIPWIQQQISTT